MPLQQKLTNPATQTMDSTVFPQDEESIKKIIDLSWAGGFIDGEGWIGIARQTRKDYDTISHRLKVAITQNNLEVLEHFKNIIGESGAINKGVRTEKMNRQTYSLVFDSRHALNVLHKIRPYLKRKGHEADAVFAMWEEGLMGKRPGAKGWPPEIYKIREKWAQKISRLK
ncbi:MAG: LAGLIDADG family homing endonuclease [Methylophaga sp.]|uniref:LAGLIDADG family homing endonuclease n=1 Tax=Methylophaga sp. TaxID=2024840 RepID=UPI00299D121C|nr:LAGLIDADG family homing endonuclease [Methylophaga sp.]MDX1749064.1 LAGLIDADG family homing endonuclease [Methylophaga sp.]|tara:strand:+ start:31747 stop:32256 length:510 start_codon:yes stop_codon:yes gene_type:complete